MVEFGIAEGIKNGVDWESLGFEEVQIAGDGLAGLVAARETAPDIVLSDVRMPGMDGLDFLHAIKELFPRIKVILISGYDDFEYLQKAIRYGADAYELKPVKIQNLLRLVEELKGKIAAEKSVPGPEIAGKPPPPRFADSRVSRAAEYVHTHLSADLSIRALGKELRMSPNYFCSLFRQKSGLTFNRYVKQTRLEASVYLLEHTDQRISEIADNTGFKDSVYFTQVFKKTYNCSPSEYRKNSRAGKIPGG
ncbi:MAG: helix-turn-helix domain-containing protein [Treponema sp.]|jgi:two-component system response regulator YesN|nr:helix-turn-helix domain-containing protein [Treponema sp.]